MMYRLFIALPPFSCLQSWSGHRQQVFVGAVISSLAVHLSSSKLLELALRRLSAVWPCPGPDISKVISSTSNLLYPVSSLCMSEGGCTGRSEQSTLSHALPSQLISKFGRERRIMIIWRSAEVFRRNYGLIVSDRYLGYGIPQPHIYFDQHKIMAL
ncbi:hypothetical protein GYMLUDRAFT_678999 [Collybiopsis luxurians FD-317 M1]|uniref:Uncharacterized protein n=1 Tax=Collybiopsis luxurians FD-317 M1 TaxID=944289 RepID=A0A0D0CLF7_9AGAR|nr:hypothetical protein GYMLUDRAFT_678999 [Collybiopsis luxurians FD-317 M1]